MKKLINAADTVLAESLDGFAASHADILVLGPERKFVRRRTPKPGKVALLSGFGWALWHYPLFLFADYGAGIPKLFSMTCFTVSVVGLSFLYAWLRLASGTVWTAMLLHATHNLFVENIFDPLTVDSGTTRFITGEFGIGFAVVGVVTAIFCWLRRSHLTAAD